MKKSILMGLVFFLNIQIFSQKFENIALKPPMGWNSWYEFGPAVDEIGIKRIADAMVQSGLADAGYEYIVIDDCWQIGRDKKGNIVADSLKFPSGIKSLADYVHSLGLKFGIYSCAGAKTCAGRPGSRGHEYQDALLYASWGVDFLKYDWCYNDKLNAEESYKTMRDALYAAKRPIVFSICEWGYNQPWQWGRDIGHLWRIAMDIRACSDCMISEYGLGWLNILERQIPLGRYAGPDHWNDPDILQVGNGGMTFYENRSHFTMWCMLAAPLMLGNNLSDIPKETLAILSNKDVIAINQDPMGKQAYRYMTNDEVDVWAKPLSEHKYAIAILNKSKNTSTFNIDWKWRGVNFFTSESDDGEYNLYDVWKQKLIGTTEESFKGKLEGRDVILLLVSRK